MNIYKGTGSADTIAPDTVSPGVVAFPEHSRPSDGVDVIDGREGPDTLNGGGGGDIIAGGSGDDRISDNPGGWRDTPNSGNVIHGNDGNDTILISLVENPSGVHSAANAAFGDGGNDSIGIHYYCSAAEVSKLPIGVSHLYGGDGNDILDITGDYVLPSDSLRQTTVYMHGDAGNDTLSATHTPSHLGPLGGDNNDNLIGGRGNDSYHVYETKDAVFEFPGQGYDTVFATNTDYTLPANVEKLVMGFDFADASFIGVGNSMQNDIVGSIAADILRGEGGADRLTGNGSDDIFDYNAVAESRPAQHDTILDFEGAGQSGGDRIDLSDIADRPFEFTRAEQLKAGQIHVVEGTGGNSLVQGEVDGKGAIDFEIEVHDGATAASKWGAGDFIL